LAKIRQAIRGKRLPAQVVWDKGGKLSDRLKGENDADSRCG
jgi:hypothetical protein